MTKEIENLLRKWAGSIELFVEECINPPKGILTQQRKVLQDIDAGYKNISVKSGHGVGKTTIMAWVIMWAGLFKYDAKIPITAPTSPQLTRLLLPEVKKWQRNLPKELKNAIEVLSDRIIFSNGNFGIPRTARKGESEGLQGFHATFLLWIVDEASGVSDEIFEVIEGSLTGENYLRLLMANPTRTVGYFHDTHTKNKKFWRTHTFNAEESENVSKESIERKRKEYGENSDQYRVRVLGEFPLTNTDALFTTDEILGAMEKPQIETDRSGVFVLGVDVARYGNDSSVVAERQGYDVFNLTQYEQFNTIELAGRVGEIIRASNKTPDAIFVDTIGVGAGTYDALESAGHRPEEANASFKADNEIYLNKRTEMYFNLRDLIKSGGRIPDDDELLEELQVLTYSFTTNGKIQLIKKEFVKEEIGRSPDKSDAVAFTVFRSVVPKDIKNDIMQLQKDMYKRRR